MKRFALLFVLLTLLSFTLSAQDAPVEQPTVAELIARYDGIPTSRTEDGGFVLGSPDAPLTLIEFADFLCPHCQTYHSAVIDPFMLDYVVTGKGKFEYRMFPVVNPELSPLTAKIAECGEAQTAGIFFPLHDYLFIKGEAGEIKDATVIETTATDFGFDVEALKTCIETATQFETDQAFGASLGVTGTPATHLRKSDGTVGVARIDGQSYARGGMPYEVVQAVFDSATPDELIIVPESLLIDLFSEATEACSEATNGCWRGFNMGESEWTTFSDFILTGEQFIDAQSVSDPNSTTQLVAWYSIASPSGEYSQALSMDGSVVDLVAVYDLASKYTLEELIAVQGDPTYAFASGNEGAAFLSLFYADKSVVVQLYVPVSADGLALTDKVIGAQYLTAERMTQIVGDFGLVPWAGVEAFETYFTETAETTE